MILKAILLTSTLLTLFFSAWYDQKYRIILPIPLTIIAICGIIYGNFFGAGFYNMWFFAVLMFIIFLTPTLSGMGFGDLLMLSAIGLYFSDFMDAGIFLTSLLLFSLLFVIREFRNVKGKVDVLKHKFAFVPSIFCAFLFWSILKFIC